MTVEDQVVIDLTDVLAIQCECRQCDTVISYPIDKWEPSEMQCPGCKLPWWTTNNPGLGHLQEFAKLWQLIKERQTVMPLGVNARTRIRFRVRN